MDDSDIVLSVRPGYCLTKLRCAPEEEPRCDIQLPFTKQNQNPDAEAQNTSRIAHPFLAIT